jgi:hypothetical protein
MGEAVTTIGTRLVTTGAATAICMAQTKTDTVAIFISTVS